MKTIPAPLGAMTGLQGALLAKPVAKAIQVPLDRADTLIYAAGLAVSLFLGAAYRMGWLQ